MRLIFLLLLTGFALAPHAGFAQAAAVPPENDPLAVLESQLATAEAEAHERHVHHEHQEHHVHLPGQESGNVHTVGGEVHHHPEPHVEHEDHSLFEVFELAFMRRAMLAGVLAGAVCTWLGLFVVLRRLVFVAVALAQVAAAGIGLGVLLHVDPVLCGMVATIAMAVVSGVRESRGELPKEAQMGLLYVTAGALAVLFLAKSGTGEAEQLEMLHGNLLIVTQSKLNTLWFAVAGTIVLHWAGFSRLIAISFDPVTATVEGVRVALWNLLFFLALGTGIGVSVQSCGLLVVFTYLLVPASIGLLSGLRIPGALATAVASQAIATVLGLWLAYELDLPGGPSIVVVSVGFLALAWLLRRTASVLSPAA